MIKNPRQEMVALGFFLFIYLFLERGEGREKGREKERERNVSCLSHGPYWGPGLHPRHVP